MIITSTHLDIVVGTLPTLTNTLPSLEQRREIRVATSKGSTTLQRHSNDKASWIDETYILASLAPSHRIRLLHTISLPYSSDIHCIDYVLATKRLWPGIAATNPVHPRHSPPSLRPFHRPARYPLPHPTDQHRRHSSQSRTRPSPVSQSSSLFLFQFSPTLPVDTSCIPPATNGERKPIF